MECWLELLDRELLVALQDLGAAGLTSAAVEMAEQGRGRDRHRRRARAAARARHGAVRDHGLRVPGADALRDEPGKRSTRSWRSASTGRRSRDDRRGHHRRPRAGAGRRAVVGEMPVSALVDECPMYDARPPAPVRAAVPGPAARARLRGPRRGAARAARLAQHRRSPPAVRAVRRDRAVAHGPPSRAVPTPPCWRCPARRRRRASRSRSTATAAASPPTPTAARSRRCSSAPRTSPAPAPSRSG